MKVTSATLIAVTAAASTYTTYASGDSNNNNRIKNKDELGDIYVFAYSWEPEFCYDQTDYVGCEDPKDYWKTHFTIHGLWPQYSSGGYPSYCTEEPFDESVPDEVGWEDMTTYWPDVQYAESSPDYYTFWEHEWTKHGTCSGLSQFNYFNTSIALIKQLGTASDVSDAVGSTMDADTLRDDYGGSTFCSLECESSKYVVGLYTCWSSEDGIPTAQIECPSDVQGEDTCSSSDVEIASF